MTIAWPPNSDHDPLPPLCHGALFLQGLFTPYPDMAVPKKKRQLSTTAEKQIEELKFLDGKHILSHLIMDLLMFSTKWRDIWRIHPFFTEPKIMGATVNHPHLGLLTTPNLDEATTRFPLVPCCFCGRFVHLEASGKKPNENHGKCVMLRENPPQKIRDRYGGLSTLTIRYILYASTTLHRWKCVDTTRIYSISTTKTAMSS